MKRLTVAAATAFAILVTGSPIAANAAQAGTEAMREAQSNAKLDKRFIFTVTLVSTLVGVAVVMWKVTERENRKLAGPRPRVNSVVALNGAGQLLMEKASDILQHLNSQEEALVLYQNDARLLMDAANSATGLHQKRLRQQIAAIHRTITQIAASIAFDKVRLELIEVEAGGGQAGAKTVKL